MILPLPRTGPSRRCRLQLTTNTRLSRPLAHRHGERAHRLRLVHLAVAEERPHLAVGGLRQAAVLHVANEARLIERHHRAEAHRHGRELPEVRHQPRMRIRRQTAAAHFLTEALQVLFGEAAFEVGTAVDARGRVSLEKHHVPGMIGRRRAPEVIEAHFVQRGAGGVAREMSAVFGGHAVRLHDHRERVPAQDGFQPALDSAVAGILTFLAGGDGVDVGRVRLERQVRARAARVIDQPFEQEMRALRAMSAEHGVDGLQPFLRFYGIEIFELGGVGHAGRVLPRGVLPAQAARGDL